MSTILTDLLGIFKNDKKLRFSVTEEIFSDTLKGFSFAGKNFSSFKELNKFLEKEMQFIFEKNKQNDLPDINNMKKTGRISTTRKTFLDKAKSTGVQEFSFDNKKITSCKEFSSCMATTCLTKGKWVYEVQILTNGLFQFGFGQLVTSFTHSDGIGDDTTSYGYDGFRKCLWHKDKLSYGKFWDIGDIIGCCIDLDNKTLEFYQNGDSLGEAFSNIITGQNVAYFPGLSLAKEESCVFNFGDRPFVYKYKGFNPIDQVDTAYQEKLVCLVNNIIYFFLSEKFIQFFNNEKSEKYLKILYCYKMILFLKEYGFPDQSILYENIIPSMSKCDEKIFSFIFDFILLTTENINQRIEFVENLFENVSVLAEITSLRGGEMLNRWESIMDFFFKMLKVDSLVSIWIKSKKCNLHLKSIFSSNTSSMTTYYDFISSHYDIQNDSSVSIKECLDFMKEKFVPKGANRIEAIFANRLTSFIKFFLEDERRFEGEAKTKDVFNKLLEMNCQSNPSNNLLLIFDLPQTLSKSESMFYKNIVFNLINLLCTTFLNVKFERITTAPWFERKDRNSVYYDEVGIGGTITTVDQQYREEINPKFIVKSDEILFTYFHRIISICQDLIVNVLFDKFSKLRHKMKQKKISDLFSGEKGTKIFESTIRCTLYLFCPTTEGFFYKISFYLIKYLIWIRENCKNMLYYIPISFFEFPFAFFKILFDVNSDILKCQQTRYELNKSSAYFSNDDYILSTVDFYVSIFSDNKICNPELKTSLQKKIDFFTKKNVLVPSLKKESKIFDHLICGLINNMDLVGYSHNAFQTMIKLVSPVCLGYHKTSTNDLVLLLKNYFEQNKEIFQHFISNYLDVLNNSMTYYIYALSQVKEKINDIERNLDDINGIIQNFIIYYAKMSEIMKLSQFILKYFPTSLLDTTLLSSLRFFNILKNISVRILGKPYFNDLLIILKKINSDYRKKKLNIEFLGFSIIGMFLELQNNSSRMTDKTKKVSPFEEKMITSDEINLEGFLSLYNEMAKVNFPEIKLYQKYIEKLISQKQEILKRGEHKSNSAEEIDKLTEEGKLCILCYNNFPDTELLPCHHSCCSECFMRWTSEKNICFICHTQIEGQRKKELSK